MSTQVLLDKLSYVLDAAGLVTGPSEMQAYLMDLRKVYAGAALAVVRPKTTEQVSKVVALCAQHNISVVPQGGHTGLCGGAAPDASGEQIVLSLQRMHQIREFDAANNTITVDAGCVLDTVQETAKQHGRLLALEHGGHSSHIGGNLSTNAGGNSVLRYGMARDQVLGLEVVLPDGQIWNGLRALRKDNTGYDLKHLFIGAEGTLGIITGAVLKLYPEQPNIETALVAIPDPRAAVNLLTRLRKEVSEAVNAFELIPLSGLELLYAKQDIRRPFEKNYQWQVLVELRAASKFFDVRAALFAVLEEAMTAGEAMDAVIAESDAQRRSFWNYREGVAYAMVEEPCAIRNDTSVPTSRIPEFLAAANAAIEAIVPGVRPVPFGHVGDGNVHFNMMPPSGMSAEEFISHRPALNAAIQKLTLEMNGSISAEHGIGKAKIDAVLKQKSQLEMDLMRSLKRTIDPHNIMNPGKVIRV